MWFSIICNHYQILERPLYLPLFEQVLNVPADLIHACRKLRGLLLERLVILQRGLVEEGRSVKVRHRESRIHDTPYDDVVQAPQALLIRREHAVFERGSLSQFRLLEDPAHE